MLSLRTLKLISYALGLLAVAHPTLVPPVLDTLGVAAAAAVAVAGWLLTNLTLALTIAAGLLLVRAFPRVPGWLGRASVAAVLPRAA